MEIDYPGTKEARSGCRHQGCCSSRRDSKKEPQDHLDSENGRPTCQKGTQLKEAGYHRLILQAQDSGDPLLEVLSGLPIEPKVFRSRKVLPEEGLEKNLWSFEISPRWQPQAKTEGSEGLKNVQRQPCFQSHDSVAEPSSQEQNRQEVEKSLPPTEVSRGLDFNHRLPPPGVRSKGPGVFQGQHLLQSVVCIS